MGIHFAIKDVCEILGIQNSRNAATRLENGEKDEVGLTDAIGRIQKTTVVSESRLYSLIIRSDKTRRKKVPQMDYIRSHTIYSKNRLQFNKIKNTIGFFDLTNSNWIT